MPRAVRKRSGAMAVSSTDGAASGSDARFEAAKEAAGAILRDVLQGVPSLADARRPRPRRRVHAGPGPHAGPGASDGAASPDTGNEAPTALAASGDNADTASPVDTPSVDTPSVKSVSSRRVAAETVDPSLPAPRGPKTAEGRAAVRGNAIKHGITADAIVIPGVESQEEWEAFREEFIAAYEPGSDAERIALEDAARLRWRKRRVERMEAETIAVAREAVEQDWRSPNEVYHSYPPTLAAARSGLDRAARIAELVEALPGMDVGHYIEPSIGDAVVKCLADGEDDDIESFRGGYATATELQLAAGQIAAAQGVSVDEVYEQGLRYAAAAVDEAQATYDYVDSSVAFRRRRASILPEATLYALSRHEAQLDRAYHRAMTQFEALKAAREGRPVPLARLQVHA